MAGCFGNHPVDRYLENQLYRYLAECDDYETIFENVTKDIPDDLFDKYEKTIDRLVDRYIVPRLRRELMTMDDARKFLADLIKRIHANKSYIKG